MKQENLQSIFQAVVSTFVAERDMAVSKMNRALNENNPNAEEVVIEQMRLLTIAKMNIANTQEEVANIQRRLQEEAMSNVEDDSEGEKPAESPSGM